jgi:hypothetical protein
VSADPHDDLGPRLESTLARRASAVRVEAGLTAARVAVDRRRARRARRRQARALGVVGLAAAVVVSAFLVARLRDDRDHEAVSSSSGLPRLALDPGLGLRRAPASSGIEGLPLSARWPGATQVQVLRRADALLPVIFAPWPSAARVGTAGTRSVDVGDVPGALSSRGAGGLHLAWRMADGTDASLDAFGVSEATLLEVARGLRRPVDPTRPGYRFGSLPPGFAASTVPAGPETRPAPVAFGASRGGLHVDVVTWASTRFDRDATAQAVLAEAVTAEPIRVAGHPGVLSRHAASTWTVGWSPTPRSSAALLITGASRADVDRIVAGVRVGDL